MELYRLAFYANKNYHTKKGFLAYAEKYICKKMDFFSLTKKLWLIAKLYEKAMKKVW